MFSCPRLVTFKQGLTYTWDLNLSGSTDIRTSRLSRYVLTSRAGRILSFSCSGWSQAQYPYSVRSTVHTYIGPGLWVLFTQTVKRVTFTESIPDRYIPTIPGTTIHTIPPSRYQQYDAVHTSIGIYTHMEGHTQGEDIHTKGTYTWRNMRELGSCIWIWLHTRLDDQTQAQHLNKKLANPDLPQRTHHLIPHPFLYVKLYVRASINTQQKKWRTRNRTTMEETDTMTKRQTRNQQKYRCTVHQQPKLA